MPPLTAADTKSLAYSVLTDAQKHRSRRTWSWTFLRLEKPGSLPRQRFNQRGAVGAVFRTIPWEIKASTLSIAAGREGIVRQATRTGPVTGPTGSGKSTTLAAMLDKINSEREEHMITIEDPSSFFTITRSAL